MSRLTIEHLAPYLPYGLKIFYGTQTICAMTLSDVSHDEMTMEMVLINNSYKPILRPMSDFENAHVLIHNDDLQDIIECIDEDNLGYLRHDLFMLLIESHFDVFNLIEQGLAIDVNTLKSH